MGLPLRLSRRQWTGIGAAVGGVVLCVAASFAPLVRATVRAEATRRHLALKVGGVRPGWFAVRLLDVTAQPDGIASIRAHVDEVRVGLSAGLRIDQVRLQGADVLLAGSIDTVRGDWKRWRGDRDEPTARSGGPSTSFEATGVLVRWVDAEPGGFGGELRGLALSRDHRGTRLSMTDGRARIGAEAIEWGEASAEADDQGKLVRGHASTLVVGWVAGVNSPPSTGPPAANEPPPPVVPSPVIARAPHTGRRLRPPAQPPADAGAPLVTLPDLHALRVRAAALASALTDRIEQGATLTVDSLTWRIAQDPGRVALTFGPGPLSFARRESRLELDYSTETHASGTPLALRVVLPKDGADVVMTIQGGPVSLSLLGVKEQAAGLVDVDRTMLAGRARVVLAGDGGGLTFDGDGSARGVSLNHPKLALETVRGLDVALRARGEVTASGDVRLDDVAATIGAARVVGSGTLEQKPDHVAAAARFEIPLATCQALLGSVPAGLLPTIQGTKIAGTFGARGHFAFDTRSLDDLELQYDIEDKCRLVQVPSSLDRDRFTRAFSHRIYLPDGSTTDETTGPGTPDWTPLDQISPYMQTAVLTTEDGAFPKHRGYNHAAIRASIIANLKARRFVRGASTITMQLAKNLFLSRDKTLSRKLEEVVLTEYLEQTFSKDEILELYLNVIEFGPAVYGVGPGAEYYFGRAPAELGLGESLFLSSILPAPLRYAAMRERDEPPESWLRTLHMLMEVAHKRGLISDAELAEGESEPILFWHGGRHPAPRAAVRTHAPAAGEGSDIPDPFVTLPDSP